MSAKNARDAAVGIMETLPPIVQAIASEMRHSENPMPMPHFRTLMLLASGQWTLSELAERQRVSLPTVSNTITVLSERGWVERVADPVDRRKAALRLTGQGTAALEEMRCRVEEVLVGRLAAVDDADLTRIMEGLAVLRGVFGSGHPLIHPAGCGP